MKTRRDPFCCPECGTRHATLARDLPKWAGEFARFGLYCPACAPEKPPVPVYKAYETWPSADPATLGRKAKGEYDALQAQADAWMTERGHALVWQTAAHRNDLPVAIAQLARVAICHNCLGMAAIEKGSPYIYGDAAEYTCAEISAARMARLQERAEKEQQ